MEFPPRCRCASTLLRVTGAVLGLVIAVLITAVPAGAAPGAARKGFNLPTDSAEHALKQLSEQAGLEVLFATDTAAGVRTNAVVGEMTPIEAAQRMLAGTRLVATQDGSSGAIVVSRSEPRVAPADRRPPAPPPPRREVDAEGPEPRVMDSVEVTGSRIRGLLGEATMQPTMILTSEEIARTGAATLAEAFRYVPEISSYTEGQFVQSPNAFGASSGDATSPRVTVNLRGAPAGGTLLLINGRRAPRNGQEQGQDGYDLSGIPLAAIERVEVLLDGASAIYGADAVGGVVNVILKRGFQHTDLRLTYGNTFDTDVHTFTSSLTHGFSKGKLSGTITLDYEEGANLMWVDRDFLRTQDRRAWGGSNNPAVQIPRDNGTISLGAGNLAGKPANTLVTIPAGANGSNKTIADYLAAGSAPPGTDLAIWAAYNSPYKRRSAVGSFEYDLKSWLTAYADVRGSSSRTEQTATPLAVSSVSIPASAPGNIFGVPVTMRRYLLDLPIATRWSETRNTSATLGVRGLVGHDWRFDASLGYIHTRPEFLNPLGFSIDSAKFLAALADPNPANRPNLFYDATQPGHNPNQAALLMSLANSDRSLEIGDTWTYLAQADGPVLPIWAGDIRAAGGVEYREEYVDFPIQSPDDLFGARSRNRYVTGVFAELRVPLAAEKNHWPLMNRLEVSAAARNDHYQEFSGATKPRYSALYRPLRWLLFRASYGEGYKLPTLNQLYAPVRSSTIFFSSANPGIDIYRGNEVLPLQLPIISGGNPNLVPEETRSTTAGVVLDVPGRWFKGWSFSYDFFDHKYLNRISPSLSFVDRLAIFPEMFQRGPNRPGDQAGWPGPIIGYDNRAVNVATNRITGWDVGTKYYYRSNRWGRFDVNFNASRVYRNENRPRPGGAAATNAVPQSLPLKMSGALYWQKGMFDTGAMFSYRDRFKQVVNQRKTGSSTRWDVRGGIDLAKSRWARPQAEHWYARWLADTRLYLTVFNVFDREPPMNASGLPDSSVLDALGRRFSLTFDKSFGGRRATSE